MPNSINFGSYNIGPDSPSFLIAEIGSNHNQNLTIAYELIDQAIGAGFDAIKFQTLKSSDIASEKVSSDEYGSADFTRGKDKWADVLDDLVMPFEWHKELFKYVKDKNRIAFSTPESPEAVDFLEELGVELYKIASMDITYSQLLLRVAKTGKPVILSSGIATLEDIFRALKLLKMNGTKEIALLHCISDYPPKDEMMSMKQIELYEKIFSIPVGFSNHREDNLLDGVAISLGAKIIEKHVTLDKSMHGPDHHFALDPNGQKDFVNVVRTTEKALKISSNIESTKICKKKLLGRSIIANQALITGDRIEMNYLEFKRPGTGISPMDLDKVIGLELKKDVSKGTPLMWTDFK